jgi:hypothetical protein
MVVTILTIPLVSAVDTLYYVSYNGTSVTNQGVASNIYFYPQRLDIPWLQSGWYWSQINTRSSDNNYMMEGGVRTHQNSDGSTAALEIFMTLRNGNTNSWTQFTESVSWNDVFPIYICIMKGSGNTWDMYVCKNGGTFYLWHSYTYNTNWNGYTINSELEVDHNFATGHSGSWVSYHTGMNYRDTGGNWNTITNNGGSNSFPSSSVLEQHANGWWYQYINW